MTPIDSLAGRGLPPPKQWPGPQIEPLDHPCRPKLARELHDFAKPQLRPYEYPRAVAFMDECPRSETGKLRRPALGESRS